MQADNAVRDETWLNDLDALDRYTAQFTLVGGGGTDFRPRIRPGIEELRQDGHCETCRVFYTSPAARGVYPTTPPGVRCCVLFLEYGTTPARYCRHRAMTPCFGSRKNLTRKDDEDHGYSTAKEGNQAFCASPTLALRDDIGRLLYYRPSRQRPILLMGPPGVGKTQIMEQIAQEVLHCAGA